MLFSDTVIKRNEGIIEAEIDGDLVMMSIDNGAYYGLDPVAKRIWSLIEPQIQVKTLCEQLLEEYQVSEEECLKDVLNFLNDMKKNNVIALVDQSCVTTS